MNKRLSILLISLIIPSSLVGQGFGHKMITIQTEPSGAELFLNNNSIGGSPATVRVQDGMLAPKYMVRAELEGYQNTLFHLDQHWKLEIAMASTCCGLLFVPAFGLLIFATEHESAYTVYLQKEEIISQPIRYDPQTGLPIE